MQFRTRFGPSLFAAAVFGFTTAAEAKALVMAVPQKPSMLAGQADIVIIGKVVEVEKETVESTPYKGAPANQKVLYKIAVVKSEEALIGGKGLTQFRVAFLEGAAPPGGPAPGARPGPGARIRPLPGRALAPVALTAGTEGCFFLSQHHSGDFYILAANGMAAPLNKKDENYKNELQDVKKVAKTLDDPVTALKAKNLNERFQAAQLILQRYQTNRGGGAEREPVPAEENKLILALLTELPWQPKLDKPRTGSDPVPPSRSALWYMVARDFTGFRQPKLPPRKAGQPPVDFNKIMDEATTEYLKKNMDKIKIKRFAK